MTEKAYWLPMFTYVNTYAFSKAARLQDLPRRAAALLFGEVEVAIRPSDVMREVAFRP